MSNQHSEFETQDAQKTPSLPSRMVQAVIESFKDSIPVSLSMYRVMIPIIIGVKILMILDLIQYIALPLEPIMHLVGLPADLGLAWATGMAVNIYSGLMVFAALVPTMEPLTAGQASIFALMLLIAHSLLVEGKIAQQCGVKMLPQIIIRVLSAIVAGLLVHWTLLATGWLSEPATLAWTPEPSDPNLLKWAFNEAINLFCLFWIIFGLMILKHVMDFFNVTSFLNALLRPVMRLLAIGPNAATITVLGICMGLIYGSGLIIREVQKGTLCQRDIFSSITLMGLAHALVEDTLLMTLIGGQIPITLGVRLLFSLVCVGIMSRFITRRQARVISN
ncbi:MAG: hypothetical protein R3Y11_04800 [Pseudomonadota bacterium]